jgi:glycosyltransferase involved in cell wall biosynthesis
VATYGETLVRNNGIRVATAHASPPFHHAIGAVRLAKKTGLKLALEVHHVVGHPVAASFQERVAYVLSRFLLPRLSKGARAVRVVNKSMVAFLASWGVNERKLHVVPSFYLDASLVPKAADVQPSVSMAFCARLVPNKNLPLVFEAMKLLPGATLVVISDGPMRKQWEEKARELGVAPRVTFRGWLGDEVEVARVMKSAHVFVMPSLSEGGPRVALEAMMLGMPVVSTKVGYMPDAIVHGANGFLADATPEAFAAVLQPLLADRALRERVGNEARKIIEQHERDAALARYARFLLSLP